MLLTVGLQIQALVQHNNSTKFIGKKNGRRKVAAQASFVPGYSWEAHTFEAPK